MKSIKINSNEKDIIEVLKDKSSEILGVEVKGDNCKEVYEFLKKYYHVVSVDGLSLSRRLYMYTDDDTTNLTILTKRGDNAKNILNISDLIDCDDEELVDIDIEDIEEYMEENYPESYDNDYYLYFRCDYNNHAIDFLDIIEKIKELKLSDKTKIYTDSCFGNGIKVEFGVKEKYSMKVTFSDYDIVTYLNILIFFYRFYYSSFDRVKQYDYIIEYEKAEENPYTYFLSERSNDFKNVLEIKKEIFSKSFNDKSVLNDVKYAIEKIEQSPLVITMFNDSVKYNREVFSKVIEVSTSMYKKNYKELDQKIIETNELLGVYSGKCHFPILLKSVFNMDKIKENNLIDIVKESIYREQI